MNIAFIGNGKMSQATQKLARMKDHNVVGVFGSETKNFSASVLSQIINDIKADVVIDFSNAEVVPRNILACAMGHIPIVEGVTGLDLNIHTINSVVGQYSDVSIVYGSNFSSVVNLLYELVREAARSLDSSFNVSISEHHHIDKKDSPSGTAIDLHKIVPDSTITSSRTNADFREHSIQFNNGSDTLEITHMTSGRETYAAGALKAAEWIIGKRGIYAFTDVIS